MEKGLPILRIYGEQRIKDRSKHFKGAISLPSEVTLVLLFQLRKFMRFKEIGVKNKIKASFRTNVTERIKKISKYLCKVNLTKLLSTMSSLG